MFKINEEISTIKNNIDSIKKEKTKELYNEIKKGLIKIPDIA
jgi:hypothetical protein